MTIKEKAKAYDKAVKEASIAYKDEDRHLKAALERIFPELKESEDERIRKALIDYFDDANKADENPLQSYGIHTDKAIAWLEEQGEQKPAEWSEKDKDNIQRALYYVDYYQTHEADTKEAEECFDWLKSLKPNHWKPTEPQLVSLTIACDRNDRVGFDLTQLLKELKEL